MKGLPIALFSNVMNRQNNLLAKESPYVVGKEPISAFLLLKVHSDNVLVCQLKTYLVI